MAHSGVDASDVLYEKAHDVGEWQHRTPECTIGELDAFRRGCVSGKCFGMDLMTLCLPASRWQSIMCWYVTIRDKNGYIFVHLKRGWQ